jgi:hypothetical protein
MGEMDAESGAVIRAGAAEGVAVATAAAGMTGAWVPMAGGPAGRKKKYQRVAAPTKTATATTPSTSTRALRQRGR